VTIPDELPTEAFVLLLLQVPPVVASAKLTVLPAQRLSGPVIGAIANDEDEINNAEKKSRMFLINDCFLK
jgi:hypothetical protein